MLPLILYAALCLQRPPRVVAERALFSGIYYQRKVYSSPRPYLLHLVTVELTTLGIRAFVTPGTTTDEGGETTARTTSEFLQEFDLQLAINANYFYPFREKTPWNFYPHTGDRVTLLGQSISNGNAYAAGQAKWAALCISANNRAQIVDTGQCPANTAQAVAGREVLIFNGDRVISSSESAPEKPYARTAVAINNAGTTLWLAVIDGKQPLYSEGVTLAELTTIFEELKADAAINLDGGGSTTLGIQIDSTPTVLNAPIHTRVPMRERPVANHLGFYAQKLRD